MLILNETVGPLHRTSISGVAESDLVPITRGEILRNCKVAFTRPQDIFYIVKILIDCFKIPNLETALEYLKDIKADLWHSVKYYDPRTMDIYGLLLFGKQVANDGIPWFRVNNTVLSKMIESCNQVQGAAFIIDKRVQGCGIDKKMLKFRNFRKPYTEHTKVIDVFDGKEKWKKEEKVPDLIWCGVNKDLKTHNYWKRLGFTEFYSDNVARFYLKMV